jgi:kynureninase
LALAPYDAALSLFEEVGMDRLIEKRNKLTNYLEFMILDVAKRTTYPLEIITPKQRGAQLSIFMPEHGREIFDYLCAHGVLPDWRNPNVIRIAPVPFYNSFSDVYEFAQRLQDAIYSIRKSVK